MWFTVVGGTCVGGGRALHDGELESYPPHREPPVAVAAQLLGVRRRRDRQLHHWQLHHTGADGDEREVVQVQRQQQRLRAGTAGG